MSTDNDDDEENEIFKWQTIPKQHKHADRRSQIGNLAKKQRANDDNPGTSNSNRFKILDPEKNIGEKGQERTDYIKPPPIFIPNFGNILNMISNICFIIPRKYFSYKSLRNNEIKVMISSINSYRNS